MSDQVPGLEELVSQLSRPGVLPGVGDAPVEVRQTHISVVFLAGERAFKLKKPVDFGFLDFSTPERRRRFAREELRLNRRLARDLYLGLAPVHVEAGALRVGEPVENPPPSAEVLVTMGRLPQERMLDRLIARGEATPRQLERLARLVAAFHVKAETGPEVERFGTREAVGKLALENFDQTEKFCGDIFDREAHQRMRARTERFLEARERLFAHRVEAGRIRDGHGDLHSPNICVLEDDTPVVYDCIEFSPQYRAVDVASEVSFLAMDLEFRGRRDLADAFLLTYLAESEDPSIEALFPFYRAYRAMVRAKIAALTASAPEVDEAARKENREAARRFFELAERDTEGMVPPLLLMIHGVPASGRRVVAGRLRRRTGMPPVEMLRLRKSLAGLDPNQPATAGEAEELFTPPKTKAANQALAREARAKLGRGEGALLVGSFTTRALRDALADVAASAGVPRLFVRLNADAETIASRVARLAPEKVDASADVIRQMHADAEPPEELSASERLDLEINGHDEEEIERRILTRLGAPSEGG